MSYLPTTFALCLQAFSRKALHAWRSACYPVCSVLSMNPVQLACVKHAASVRPEPGSNPQIKLFIIQVSLSYFIDCSSLSFGNFRTFRPFACFVYLWLFLPFIHITFSFTQSVWINGFVLFLHCSIFNVHYRSFRYRRPLLSITLVPRPLSRLSATAFIYYHAPFCLSSIKKQLFYVNFSQAYNETL
jgi:hypothetical protein